MTTLSETVVFLWVLMEVLSIVVLNSSFHSKSKFATFLQTSSLTIFLVFVLNEQFHGPLLFFNRQYLFAEEVDVVTESLAECFDILVCSNLLHAKFEVCSVFADGLVESFGLILDNFGEEGKATGPRLRILHSGTFIGLTTHYEEVI